MKALPKFNPKAVCPKCGCRMTVETCHEDAVPYAEQWHDGGEAREHLRRRCLRCRYGWNEKVLK